MVLQTTDLKNFDFATALGYNPQVMTWAGAVRAMQSHLHHRI